MDKDTAKRVMAAAGAKAEEIGKPVCIAIVDVAGTMVLFERFCGGASFSAIVAEGKATGSAFTGRDAPTLKEMTSGALGEQLAGRRFFASQGGVPLITSEGTIGGIGVSGSSAQEDEVIARAGAAALSTTG
jgi:cob(I)alamin adenosyltransferase